MSEESELHLPDDETLNLEEEEKLEFDQQPDESNDSEAFIVQEALIPNNETIPEDHLLPDEQFTHLTEVAEDNAEPTYDNNGEQEVLEVGVEDDDLLLVHSQSEEGGIPRWNIQIEKEDYHKPFLGGFRDRRTMIEYHHAATQTPPPPKPADSQQKAFVQKFHRDAQTVEVKTRSTQQNRDSYTQMEKIGYYYIEPTEEKVIIPRKYFTADENHKMKIAKAIRIQTLVRSWLARKRAQRLKVAQDEKILFLLEQEHRQHQETLEIRNREIERRRNPKTKEDFDILYSEVHDWVANEKDKIEKTSTSEPERKALLRELLGKETKLLQTIDRLKLKAGQSNKSEAIRANLKAMAASKKLPGKDGEVVKIHTPFTTRSKELKKLYDALTIPNLAIEERREVLIHVKLTVEEFDCKLTREIGELIGREVDLLRRGRPESMMQGSRQRLVNLFLQFIENPEFNPEAAKYKDVPVSRANTLPVKPRYGPGIAV